MRYSFVPKSLFPKAKTCTVYVRCDITPIKIRWSEKATFPYGLEPVSDRIKINKNGTYFVEITTPEETVIDCFTICHLNAFHGFDGGDGSKENPFLISDCVQFNAIRLDMNAHYRLTADLDFGKEMENLSWLPIGQYSQKEPKIDSSLPLDEQNLSYIYDFGFCGELDGGGHTIYGLHCRLTRKKNIGIFGSCGKGAFIHHLRTKNGSFLSTDDFSTGGIVGRAEASVISHCQVEADIGAATVGGGIIGGAWGTDCIACQFTGKIYLETPKVLYGFLGGIIGAAVGRALDPCEGPYVRILDCCADVILFNAWCAGAIATGNAQVFRCLARGTIWGSGRVCGIISDGMLSFVASCVSAVRRIENVSGESATTQESAWITFCDEELVQLGSEYIKDAWQSCVGRIMCYDYTLMSGAEKNRNYASESCRLIAAGTDCPIVEGSKRDGTTVSDSILLTPEFYRSLGWDSDHVWKMEKGRFPTLL